MKKTLLSLIVICVGMVALAAYAIYVIFKTINELDHEEKPGNDPAETGSEAGPQKETRSNESEESRNQKAD